MTLLTDALRSRIGQETFYPAREALGRASIRYFVLALGDENPIYTDDAYAQTIGHRSLIAPPTLVCETCQYSHRAPGANGYIGHEWELPLPTGRVIRGGNEYEFFRPVYPDDQVSVRWHLEDIIERTSSRGSEMLFITSFADYENQQGERLASNRETTIFQPIDPSKATKVAAGSAGPKRSTKGVETSARGESVEGQVLPAIGDLMVPLERHISSANMMAYGAATWDWHRLHYDHGFAQSQGLPAPVLDGQVFGAFFSKSAIDWLGPTAFVSKLAFRMRSMVFAGDDIRCEGEVTRSEPDGEALAITLSQRLSVGERLAADANIEIRID